VPPVGVKIWPAQWHKPTNGPAESTLISHQANSVTPHICVLGLSCVTFDWALECVASMHTKHPWYLSADAGKWKKREPTVRNNNNNNNSNNTERRRRVHGLLSARRIWVGKNVDGIAAFPQGLHGEGKCMRKDGMVNRFSKKRGMRHDTSRHPTTILVNRLF
jgi:hypothetical protein